MSWDEDSKIVLVRKDKPNWEFRFDYFFHTPTYKTQRNTIYGIFSGVDCGKPFWIGRLIGELEHKCWVTYERELKAVCLLFQPLNGIFVFPDSIETFQKLSKEEIESRKR